MDVEDARFLLMLAAVLFAGALAVAAVVYLPRPVEADRPGSFTWPGRRR
jgi:hypothetical protein